MVPLLACHAFLERMNMNTVQQTVKLAAKDNTNFWLVNKPVWIVLWVNT